MNKLCLVAGTVVLLLSIVCIGGTVIEMAKGEYGLGAARFWGAAGFHAVSGVVAALLLAKGCQKDAPVSNEEQT